MLNQNPSDEENDFLHSYVELLEEMPSKLSRVCSVIRELDVQASSVLQESSSISSQLKNLPTGDAKVGKLYHHLQNQLINMQEINGEKISYSTLMLDLIEKKNLKVAESMKHEPLLNISNIKQEKERVQSPTLSIGSSSAFGIAPTKTNVEKSGNGNTVVPTLGTSSSTSCVGLTASSNNNNNGGNGDRSAKRARRTRTDTGIDLDSVDIPIKQETQDIKQQVAQVVPYQKKISTSGSKQKKKKKVGRQNIQTQQQTVRETPINDPLPQEETIDPDEPTYCLCEQISFGEMILCDNDLCPMEWFHFSCVNLMNKPRGKWYCPNCRGDRPNVFGQKNKVQTMKGSYKKEKF